MDYYALIMAGGVGTRLWPLSRPDRPKQTLSLVDERSMFQLAVDRLAPLFDAAHVLVVTGEDYVAPLAVQTPDLPHSNFIVEPAGGPRRRLGWVPFTSTDAIRRR